MCSRTPGAEFPQHSLFCIPVRRTMWIGPRLPLCRPGFLKHLFALQDVVNVCGVIHATFQGVQRSRQLDSLGTSRSRRSFKLWFTDYLISPTPSRAPVLCLSRNILQLEPSWSLCPGRWMYTSGSNQIICRNTRSGSVMGSEWPCDILSRRRNENFY